MINIVLIYIVLLIINIVLIVLIINTIEKRMISDIKMNWKNKIYLFVSFFFIYILYKYIWMILISQKIELVQSIVNAHVCNK